MNKTIYREIICKSAINKLKNHFPCPYDLNIYRGCIHKCQYCYAVYSHSYINSRDFFNEIFVKKNIVEVLEKELSSKNWNREIINLGSVTDSYQEAEENYKFMPEILKLLIKYKTPMNIFTKSDLMLRDYDLICELSKIAYVNISSSITTANEKLASLIEPSAHAPKRRFNMLKEFTKTNASVGVNIIPIMPYITDNSENIEEIFQNIKLHNIHYEIHGMLNLKGSCRRIYLNFIRKSFPNLYEKYLNLYGNWWQPKKEYSVKIYKMIRELEKKHEISRFHKHPLRDIQIKKTVNKDVKEKMLF